MTTQLPYGLQVVGDAPPTVLGKRKATAPPPSEYLEITPLGAGNEVGRSCIMLKYKGKSVMLDCGIHPAYNGIAALPYFDEIDPASIDLLLVTHFHLDHAAALPYFLAKTDFKGRVFMTHPTKSIYKLILQDYVKVSTISVEETLYTEKDLLNSMEKIETVNYHQSVHVNGIKFGAYNAGHVLGAAMFMIEIAGVKILYTGDYSRKDDRHLTGAETPNDKPDVLIIESTYGTQTLLPVKDREKLFTDRVHQIIRRGGRCLIPVFALGRAQELLLILDEYWEKNHSLQSYPIYYASALAKKCMAVYQTYINMMNPKIQKEFETSNPFLFRHVRFLKGMDDFDDVGPSVVFASPGMLQNGFSRELFEIWCTNKKNGVIIPGYSVEGTLAKTITLEPDEIESMNGETMSLNMSVHYVTFSAHADFADTSEFVDQLRPRNVILVHGDSNEMSRLNQALERRYEEENKKTNRKLRISTPKNCQTVELIFRSQKIAKTVGSLAVKQPKAGDVVSGLAVMKDYRVTVMSPDDLPMFTPLAAAEVEQTMKIPFKQSMECLRTFAGQIYEISPTRTSHVNVSGQGREVVEKVEEIMVYNVRIILHREYEYLTLSWASDPVQDMVADSLIALILKIEAETSQGIAKAMHAAKETHTRNTEYLKSANANIKQANPQLHEFLKHHYGSSIEYDGQHDIFIVTLDDRTAIIHNSTLEVDCRDSSLKKRLEYIMDCCRNVIFPIKPPEMLRLEIIETEGTGVSEPVEQTAQPGVQVREEADSPADSGHTAMVDVKPDITGLDKETKSARMDISVNERKGNISVKKKRSE
eukprot:271740_1